MGLRYETRGYVTAEMPRRIAVMRKRIGVVGAIGMVWAVFLVITLVGLHNVNTQKAELTSWNAELQHQQASLDSAKTALAQAKKKFENEQYDWKNHVEDVERVRQSLVPSLNWSQQLVSDGGWYSNLNDQCSRFHSMEFAVSVLDSPDIIWPKASWEEVCLDRKTTLARFREEGLRTARELTRLFDEPLNIRRTVTFGQGEGSWELDDCGRLMYEVQRALENVNATPTDIGWTAADLRQALIQDVTEKVIYAHTLRGDDRRWELWEAHNACREYRIATAMVGLTKSDLKLLDS